MYWPPAILPHSHGKRIPDILARYWKATMYIVCSIHIVVSDFWYIVHKCILGWLDRCFLRNRKVESMHHVSPYILSSQTNASKCF